MMEIFSKDIPMDSVLGMDKMGQSLKGNFAMVDQMEELCAQSRMETESKANF